MDNLSIADSNKTTSQAGPANLPAASLVPAPSSAPCPATPQCLAPEQKQEFQVPTTPAADSDPHSAQASGQKRLRAVSGMSTNDDLEPPLHLEEEKEGPKTPKGQKNKEPGRWSKDEHMRFLEGMN